ncbi:peptidyl-prolyl cis-trans isomerase FKBP16-1, chloroplastic [Silene latifolia]|uniref:peptidyl-prolyl cis-trans isomerase FKBP16-1, chloroplastic n=1 Tax=Silene latifolia TaxID=37657 RepID=UPI003D76DC04
MAATAMASYLQLPITRTKARHSFQPRCNSGTRKISIAGIYSASSFDSCTFGIHSRRLLLFIGSIPFWSNTNPAFGALMPQIEEPEIIRTRKLDGGVRVQDIVDGDGSAANDGDVVEFNYVCRRANGYFVYSTVDQFSGEAMPIILPLDENQMIKGLKEVLIGMKIGGKRRALIPPAMGYVNENLKPIPEEFGPRRSLLSHANEPLVFEVQLLKIL